MKQLEAIDKILEIMKKDKAVRALFIKGSIARGQLDEYSDVDFYCIVKDDELEDFLKRRLSCLKQYKPLIYWSEANFVGPQIVAVFNNGLHFDLYTVTLDTLQNSGEIKVLYDPEKLLKDYKPEHLTISDKNVIKLINEFTFTMLEFEAAYCRNDLLWASRLASHLSGELSVVLRYLFDKKNAKLGFKRLYKKLDESLYKKLKKAMDLSGPSYLPKGVILLGEIIDEIIKKLPHEISSKVNTEFLYYMLDKINRL